MKKKNEITILEIRQKYADFKGNIKKISRFSSLMQKSTHPFYSTDIDHRIKLILRSKDWYSDSTNLTLKDQLCESIAHPKIKLSNKFHPDDSLW